MSVMDTLVGRAVTGLLVSANQHVRAFETDRGIVAFVAYGDCCSETWFADITGVTALLGATVAKTEEVDMPDGYNVNDGRGRQEADCAYGYRLTTDRGYVDVVFRNSSNGYYGGSIERHFGDLPSGMVRITDDWAA